MVTPPQEKPEQELTLEVQRCHKTKLKMLCIVRQSKEVQFTVIEK